MISISDISIVIVLYQELPPAYIYEDFGVNYILVDNTPGRNLNLDIPNVYYIPLDENYGIAKALNVGFSCAKKQGFSWVLTMDQDSLLSQNMLAGYTKFINVSHQKIGIVCPLLQVYRDEKVLLQDSYVQVNEALTSGSLINMDAYDAAGGFLEKLFIDEVPQHWELGKFKQEHILFSVRFVPISYNGDTVIWGKTDTTGVNTGMAPITNVPSTVTPYQITNGKTAADLEWFCMGSRGDIYRQVGYPNNITTQYMVDPSKTYHYINIHYASKGDNVDIQEQEKDLTLMIEVGTVPTADINKLISDINTLTGSADGDSLYLTPLA